MIHRLRSLLRHVLAIALYGITGALLTLLVVFVLFLHDRPDLSVWHTADLDEEFTADSDVTTFEGYLELEERLFKLLHEEVYDKIRNDQRSQINRFNRNSLSDPERRNPNWNRSYELSVSNARGGVLLLHGLSDSPYSLRELAGSLHRAGFHVVGLRIPGHGTAPSGLTTVTWQDMDAAVRLAVRHVAGKAEGRPVYMVGYSNGGALAVNYALAAVADSQLPRVDRLALVSPEIGLPRVAALAKWQARLGRLLGMEKLAWNGLMPEYDPYKYGSFAVNAGNVAYQMTQQVQKRLDELKKSDDLAQVPPILAFTSLVDATVSAPALVDGLFNRIPPGDHELVLFDINRMAEIGPLLKAEQSAMVSALQVNPGKTYTLSLVTNSNAGSRAVMLSTLREGSEDTVNTDLALNWPENVYSLSHVALPFPPDDPLYGIEAVGSAARLQLGDLALRGERGVLQVPASEMLRLRSNPFYSLLEEKILAFFDADEPR